MTKPAQPDAPNPQQAAARASGKPVKPRKGRRFGRLLFWMRAVFIVCLAPLVFALAAAVMIIDREITAPSWVSERIEARAAEVLEGGQLRFGAISMRIGRDLHPVVRLRDTTLTDAGGLVITRVPIVEGLVSPRGLIFQQDLLLQDVLLVGAQVNLRRAADGSVSVALINGGNEVGRANTLPELLDQVDHVFERPALEALETVRAAGLIVNFDDARAGRSWIVDGGTVDLDLTGGQTALRGNFALLSGGADVTNVNLSYTSPRGSHAADIGLNIDNALASDIAAQSPALSWLREVEAPIDVAMRTGLDEAGALGPVSASLEIGQGVLQPNAATAPFRFDQAKAYLTYDPQRDQIAFTDVSLQTEWGAFQASGTSFLREFQDGLPQALLAQFQFQNIALNPPGFYDTPPSIPDASVDLRLRFDPFRIELGQLVINDGQTRLIADGELAATDAGWQMALNADVSEMAPDQLMAIWPIPFKPKTRDWFSNNLLGGRLFGAALGLRVTPGQPNHFAAGFEFDDATVRFMRQMPPITGGRGAASFIDNGLVIAVDDGVVNAPEGGQLNLAGSVFSIGDVRPKPATGTLDLRADGSVTSVLSILNQPPFEFLDKANLPVTLADGRAEVTGLVSWPMRRGGSPNDVSFEMAADLRRVRTGLIPGRDLVAPRLTVAATRAGLTLTGPVSLDGAPAEASWSRAFGEAGRNGSQIQAQVEISPDVLNALDINLPPGTVSGLGQGALTVDLIPNAPPRFTLTSDLRGVRVAIPAIGWAKSANTAGNLLIEGTLGAVPDISNLEISGGGLSAQGRISLAAGGGLETAVFSRVRVADWLNAPITLRGRGAGRPVGVEIRGGTLDLRRASFGSSQGEAGPVSIALDRLQVTEGIALDSFRGDFSGAGGFTGQFTAQLNGGAAVRGTVAPRNGRSAVRLVSEDAGGALRAAGFLRNANGGTLDLTLLPTGGEGTFDGTLAVRDLRLRDAPTMAALLDAISVVGLLQQLDGQGLAFDEVDARFRLTPNQVIVSEASAVGPGLGISVDGTYTLGNQRVDLQGVVSPFYVLNGIGSFLTRKGEGLIGFNFNIAGTSRAPQVTVNPLSAFTPGMFREIFRRPAPELSQ
ncbi:AsmA-like C-terminal region-containing protein [Yoonia sp. BS5-3]|uniref:AsmA-like C-terminal region-containing protein n=1 Tax=Yoonia phaeophyticola TaxID=3137369 RepID=A0ABZ2UZS7_9RHOB